MVVITIFSKGPLQKNENAMVPSKFFSFLSSTPEYLVYIFKAFTSLCSPMAPLLLIAPLSLAHLLLHSPFNSCHDHQDITLENLTLNH